MEELCEADVELMVYKVIDNKKLPTSAFCEERHRSIMAQRAERGDLIAADKADVSSRIDKIESKLFQLMILGISQLVMLIIAVLVTFFRVKG